MSETLRKNMIKAREFYGYSKAAAARKMGVQTGQICAWEDGSRRPSIDSLIHIIEAYHVHNVIAFITDENFMEGNGNFSPDGEIIAAYRALNHKERMAVNILMQL